MSSRSLIFFSVMSLFAFSFIECRSSSVFTSINQLIGQWYVTDMERPPFSDISTITCASMKMKKINENSGQLIWNETRGETHKLLETVGTWLPHTKLIEEFDDGSWNATSYISLFNRGNDILFLPDQSSLPILVLSRNKKAAPSTYRILSRALVRTLKLHRVPNIGC